MQPALFGLPPEPAGPGGGGVKAGPKAQADLSALPWNYELTGADSLAWFAESFLVVPRGKGAGGPMEIRPSAPA